MGTVTATNGILTWNIGTLTNGDDARWFVTVLPGGAGTFTNTLTYSGGSGLAIYTTPVLITVLPNGPPPTLGIQLVGSQIQLHWPTNATGFRLQRTRDLGASRSWGTITNIPAAIGQEFRLQLTPGTDVEFYRLIQP
jgi:hypothetical protein